MLLLMLVVSCSCYNCCSFIGSDGRRVVVGSGGGIDMACGGGGGGSRVLFLFSVVFALR